MNNHETEQELVSQSPESIQANQARQNVEFQVDFDGYLRQIEDEFEPLKDQVNSEQLTQIKHDLNEVRNGRINPQNSESASRSLLMVFNNMEAWQKQMRTISGAKPESHPEAENHYLSSKKIFMDRCRELYPGERVYLNLIGAEMLAMERDINSIDLPEVKQEVGQVNLNEFALQVEDNLEQDPVGTVKNLEKIILLLSNGVEKTLARKSLNAAEEKELSRVVKNIFKLESYIDAIRDSDSFQKAASNKRELAAVGKSEKKEDEREKKLLLADQVWNKYLKTAFKSVDKPEGMTIEEYLSSQTRPVFDAMELDATQNEYISEILPGIWEEYRNEDQPQKNKIENFKLRIGEMLHKASEM